MRRVVCVLFLGVLLLAAPAHAVDGSESLDVLTTLVPVAIEGATELDATEGAFRATSPRAMTGSFLVAESAIVDVAWERGIDAGMATSLLKLVTERGEEEIPLRDAEIRFDADASASVMMAFSEPAAARYVLGSTTGLSLAPERDATVVGIGFPPDGVTAGDSPDLGFWYRSEGPTVHAHGPGLLRLEGSFSVFVHNVTIDAHTPSGDWSGWTGYREEPADQPVAEFEFRVTVIRVENGTLVVPTSENAALFSPALEGRVDGTVSSAAVTGRLRLDGGMLALDRDPLQLRGSGRLAVKAIEPTRSLETGAALALRPSGDFEVLGADGKLRGASAPGSPWGLPSLLPLAGLGLVVLTAAGMAELGLLPGPTPSSRRRRSAHWLRRGRSAALHAQWPRAAFCFARAVRLQRGDPFAWYKWAHAELEAGRYQEALEVIRHAEQVSGIDVADLLELQVRAAWHLGDPVESHALLHDLVAASPAAARLVVQDLEIDVASLEPPLRHAVDPGIPEDEPDGYA